MASEADGADGEAQLSGDFAVRTRWRLEKEEIHEAAALRRQNAHGFAEHLFFLGLLHQSFGDSRSFRVGEIRVSIAADYALLLALPAVALVVSNLDEPLRQSLGFAEIGQAPEKLNASGLKYVGSFVRRQSVFNGHGVNERFIFFDEKRPRFFAAREAVFYETFVA